MELVLVVDEPCSAGRNINVAPPFEAALVAMRLGSAIPTVSVSPSFDLSADVKTGGATSTSIFRPAEQGSSAKRGAAMEMAQIKNWKEWK